MERTERILALDPATYCGWCCGVGEDYRFGCWALGFHSSELPGNRLVRFYRHMADLYDSNPFTVIASEDAGFGTTLGRGKSIHGQFLGIIYFFAAERNIPVILYHPTTIKAVTTGSGRAYKSQMVRAVKIRYGVNVINDDEADAIAIYQICKSGIIVNASKKPPKPKGGKKAGRRAGFKHGEQSRMF